MSRLLKTLKKIKKKWNQSYKYNVQLMIMNLLLIRKVIIGKTNVLIIKYFETIDNILKIEKNRVINIKKKPLYYSKPMFSVCGKKILLTETAEIFTVIINNACVIGGSNAVIVGSKIIYQIKEFDVHSNILYSDHAIKAYSNRMALIEYQETDITFDRAIYLGGNYSWNYYHFIYEFLVKFEYIEKNLVLSEIPVLIDKNCLKIKQFRELIRIFNKKRNKIVSIDEGKLYKINNFYFISLINLIPPNYKKIERIKENSCLFSYDSLLYIRKKLIHEARPVVALPKKIFLLRSNASKRRVYNEDEVYSYFKALGFIGIYPEKLSITEQVEYFMNADYIAGGSGAAFSNIICCKPKCKIIIFTKARIPFSGFSTIANLLNIDMLYITEESDNTLKVKTLHEAFYIEINILNQLIETGFIN